jgi:hypothetical protein
VVADKLEINSNGFGSLKGGGVVRRCRFDGGNEGHRAALWFLGCMVCGRANGGAGQR